MSTPIEVSEVTIILEENEVVVTQLSNEMDVTAPGPQGPPGPAGADGQPGRDGAPGGSFYTHDQTVPSASWSVEHNLNRLAHITVFDADGFEVLADIEQSDPNTASIVFATPVTGKAVVS